MAGMVRVGMPSAVVVRLQARALRIAQQRRRSVSLEKRAKGYPAIWEVVEGLLDHIDNDQRRKRESRKRVARRKRKMKG